MSIESQYISTNRGDNPLEYVKFLKLILTNISNYN